MEGMILKFRSILGFISFHKILEKFVSNLLIPGPKNVESNFNAIIHNFDYVNIYFINSNHEMEPNYLRMYC